MQIVLRTYQKFFLIFYCMVIGALCSCTMHSRIGCLKNCAEGEVLVYSESSYSFEINSKVESIVPEWRLDDGISNCTIKPSLPLGLNLEPDCSLSGVPTETFPAQTYVVTALSAAGNKTVSISLQITKNGEAPLANKLLGFIEGQRVDQSVASLVSSAADQASVSRCRISPALPLGLKLSEQCQLTGSPAQPLVVKDFTLFYFWKNSERRETLRLSVVSVRTPDLLLMVDPRLYNGQNPINQVACVGGVDLNIFDLSPWARHMTYEAPVSCSQWGGGIGSLEDPYHFNHQSDSHHVSSKNSIDYGFQNQSGTLIFYFYRQSPNSSISASYGIPETYQKEDLWWNLDLNEPYLYGRPFGTPTTFFESVGQNGNNLIKIENSFRPMTQEWHQIAYSADLESQKIKIYIDGKLAESTDKVPKHNMPVTSNLDFRGSKVSLGNLAVYNRILSDTEIANQCLGFQTVYGNLRCQNAGVVGLILEASENPEFYQQSFCHPLNWIGVNNLGAETQSQIKMTFQLTSDQGQFYTDDLCQNAVQTIDLGPEVSSRGRIYFKTSGLSNVILNSTPILKTMNKMTTKTKAVKPVASSITLIPGYDDCSSIPGSLNIQTDGGVFSRDLIFDIYEGGQKVDAMSLKAFSTVTQLRSTILVANGVFTLRNTSHGFNDQVFTMPSGTGCSGGD